MAMVQYRFLGCRRLDFTNRETGQLVQGYQLHFTEPSDGHGVGVVPFKVFLNDDRFDALGLSLDLLRGKEYYPVDIVFGRNGRVDSFMIVENDLSKK